MDDQNRRNVSVHFSSITLDGSQWKFHGLNVFMNQANLTCSTVKVQGDKMKSQFPTVNITGSTFGQLNISEGCHVQISDFNFITILCKHISIRQCHLCVDNSYVNFSNSEVRIMEEYFPLHFMVARNSYVSVEQTLFSCKAMFSQIINVEGGKLLLKKVIFQNIRKNTLISLQSNVLATIQDTTFINAYGNIYASNKVDLTMSGCRFSYTSFTEVILHLIESGLSIYDSWLHEVYICVQNSSSLAIASCTCSFSSIRGKTYISVLISVFDNSKVLVTDTEVNHGNVIFGSDNFDVKFTNCTFASNQQLIETKGGTISIKSSRITRGLQFFYNQNPISLSRNSHLYLESTNITNNNKVLEGITFLVAKANSYFKMTKCLYKMNDFTTHFSIKDHSTMIIVDSVISQNNSTSQILDIEESKCFLQGTSINFNRQNNNLEAFVKLSVAKVIVARCSFTKNVFSTRMGSFFLEGIASNVSVINSTITAMSDLSGLGIIKLDSSVNYTFTYLQLVNSNFNLKQTNVCWLTGVSVVIFANTNFYVETNTMMQVFDTKDMRIAYSQLILKHNYEYAWMKLEAASVKTQVLTLESNFSDNRHHFLSSKDKEFVKKASDYKLILFNRDIQPYESDYASSKYDTSLTLHK